jgi:hypothetical protein
VRALGVLLGLLLAFSAQAADAGLAIAEQALAEMDGTSIDGWAFTETMLVNGTEIVLRHEPTHPKGERWIVASVDGRAPTDKEIEKYTRHRDRDEEETDDGETSATIETDSLVLLEESASHLIYSFRPAPEKGGESDAFNEHVDGRLRIAKSGPFVETIEMRSRESFSPMIGVKIKQFSTLMTFAPVGESGDILPQRVEMRMEGRAMLVKKLDESVDTRFSDYRFIGVPE